MTNKEINSYITKLLNIPKLYDLRCQFRIVDSDLSWEAADARFQAIEPEHKHLYSITTAASYEYTGDVAAALEAARTVANKSDHTVVLTYNPNESWKAAYGDYKDCFEYVDADPAYAVCMALVGFMKEHQ